MIIVLTIVDNDVVSATIEQNWDAVAHRVEHIRRYLPVNGTIFSLVVSENDVDIVEEHRCADNE